MGLSSVVRNLALGAAVTGCAVIAGLDEPEPAAAEEDITKPSSDSATPPEAASDASPGCTVRVEPAVTDGKLAAPAWEGPPPEIDGAFTDWACVSRHDFGEGVFTSAKFPAQSKAQIAFRWTKEALFFYASIETTTPGYQRLEGFANDSINLYLGPPNPTIRFRESDHQLSFDHRGNVSHYVQGVRTALPPTIRASMKPSAQEGMLAFEVEVKIEPSVLGVSAFDRGQRYMLGLQLHDRISDSGGVEWRTWYRGPACGCSTSPDPNCCTAQTGGKNLIVCDLRCTGELVLE